MVTSLYQNGAIVSKAIGLTTVGPAGVFRLNREGEMEKHGERGINLDTAVGHISHKMHRVTSS